MNRFSLSLLFVILSYVAWAQPANNNFASAVSLTHGPLASGCSANAAYTTVAATGDMTAGNCWNTSGGSNVWFKFTATTTKMHFDVIAGGSVGTGGTLQHAYAALWDNTGTIQLVCNTYATQYSGVSLNYANLTIGQDYYISVDNHNGSTGYRGTFKICLGDDVDYDYYEGATTLAMNSTSANAAYTTVMATRDKNNANCWNTNGGSNRWFKFVATTTTITANVYTGGAEGSLQHGYMALWEADGTTQLGCVQYVNQYDDLEISAVGLTPGNTYYISVDNHNGTSGYRGSFKIGINDAVTYDYYEGAVALVMNSTSANAAYTTVMATRDKNHANCWNTNGGSNRWFKFVATTTTITANVYTGGAEGSLQHGYMA
ncbi:MAG: hypothetical protein HOP30_11395, partial [Cyclobacteriaceae bacterium]|nr:hypothetical protein [Cyclobacteriaceae bacterium]